MIDFDLDQTADDIERFAQTGGLLPAGKHHVRLESCKPATANSGLTGEELLFVVASGPFAGSEIKETLWDSDKGGAKKRATLFAHRLGVLERSGAGFKLAKDKYGFADALGAEVVVEVQHEEYTNKHGKKGKVARVTFAGIWKLDDPAAKGVSKGAAKADDKNAAKETAAQAGRKKVDTSNL